MIASVTRFFTSLLRNDSAQKAESIFKEIIEKNPMSIQILNMEGYSVQTNSAHTKIFGLNPPPDYTIFKDPQLAQQGFENLLGKMKKGEIVYFPDSYYNVHDIDSSFPDNPVWVKALGFTLNSNNGIPDRIVLMHEDITERKQTEALLSDIIGKNPLSIQIVDKEGYTLHGNPAYIKLFGAIPPPDFSIFTDLERKSPEIEKLILVAKRGEIVNLPDIYFNAHDAVPEAPDNPLWIRALIFPLKDSAGKPDRFVFMHENITERKIAEEEIRKIGQHYQALIEKAPDGVVLIDAEGNFKYISPSAKKMFGFDLSDEVIGHPAEFTHPDDLPMVLTELSKTLSDPTYIPTLEYRYKNKDGGWIWVETTFSNLLANPSVESIVLNFRNISERKQVEDELRIAKQKAEESDRLKSAFLANMSHEIRTPMNGILGFAELLKEPGQTGEQQQEYVRIIEKSGIRMLNIINDIIDISKIEAGLMTVNSIDTNINERIEFIHSFFKFQAEEKKIQLLFKTPLPAGEAIIKTDDEKFYSILINLVRNAIKFTKKGSIELGYDIVGPDDHLAVASDNQVWLRFYVKDTGIGIPKDRQAAIFERFIQADVADKMARQGAGLGLSITRAYVEMLGGKIWVQSEEGKGSTFYFTLPYQNDQSGKNKDMNMAKTDTINGLNKKIKILIAEDDEPSEILISLFVKEFCEEVIKAKDGIEAVELCRTNPDIDLILMDIQLPELSGYEATQQIRQFNKDVVIIAQTAYGLSGDRGKAIEAGCNDYIAKPINKNELIALIRKYFDQ